MYDEYAKKYGQVSVACKPWIMARGGTTGIFWWGCATGTLEPLAYSRANSA